MRLARLSADALVPECAPGAGAWEESLRSACETLTGMPEESMQAISMAGKLSGVEGEALHVMALSKQLGMEYGVRQVVEVKGHRFTARFWRQDFGPDRRRARLYRVK